jgi:hypothetical protein
MTIIHVPEMDAIYFMYNWIQFFVSMYNDTTLENDFNKELNNRGEYI